LHNFCIVLCLGKGTPQEKDHSPSQAGTLFKIDREPARKPTPEEQKALVAISLAALFMTTVAYLHQMAFKQLADQR